MTRLFSMGLVATVLMGCIPMQPVENHQTAASVRWDQASENEYRTLRAKLEALSVNRPEIRAALARLDQAAADGMLDIHELDVLQRDYNTLALGVLSELEAERNSSSGGLEAELIEARSRVQALKDSRRELRATIAQLESRLDQANRTIASLRASRDSSTSMANICAENEHLRTRVASLRSEVRDRDVTIQRLEESIEALSETNRSTSRLEALRA